MEAWVCLGSWLGLSRGLSAAEGDKKPGGNSEEGNKIEPDRWVGNSGAEENNEERSEDSGELFSEPVDG